jgi:hypothetical protein
MARTLAGGHLETKARAERCVPLFSDLLPHLEAAYDAASEGDEFFASPDTATPKLVWGRRCADYQASGLEAWPKLFKNAAPVGKLN